MTHLERLAYHYLKVSARRSLTCGSVSLTLYDETELELRVCRRAYARMADEHPSGSHQRQIYREMVTAVGMALVLLDIKRRIYIRRTVDKVFAAPQRVPERGKG